MKSLTNILRNKRGKSADFTLEKGCKGSPQQRKKDIGSSSNYANEGNVTPVTPTFRSKFPSAGELHDSRYKSNQPQIKSNASSPALSSGKDGRSQGAEASTSRYHANQKPVGISSVSSPPTSFEKKTFPSNDSYVDFPDEDYLKSNSTDYLSDALSSLDNSLNESTSPRTFYVQELSTDIEPSTDVKKSNQDFNSSMTKPRPKIRIKNPRFGFRAKETNQSEKSMEKTNLNKSQEAESVGLPQSGSSTPNRTHATDLNAVTAMLENIQEENKALEIEIRGKDEELQLLNATMDQVNQTWERKVFEVMKDLENAKRKNEHLRLILSQETSGTVTKPTIRVPISADTKPNRRQNEPKETQGNSSGANKTSEAERSLTYSNSADANDFKEATKETENKISASIKTEEIKEKLLVSLSSSKCLSQMSRDKLHALVDAMKCKRIIKGERLMQEGRLGTAFYVLSNGECIIYKHTGECVSPNISEEGTPVALWEVFGEADVFYNTHRVWSCKCLQQGMVWFLSREEFKAIVMQQDVQLRKKEVYCLLRKIKCFDKLTTSQFQMLTNVSKIVQYAPGDYIFRQGGFPNYGFVVKEGEVTHTRHNDGAETVQNTMRVGELFGESEVVQRRYEVNAVASGMEVVQCILIPLQKLRSVRAQELVLSEKITPERVKNNLIKINEGSGSTTSNYTANTSSGYGSDVDVLERKQKPLPNSSQYTASFLRRASQLQGANEDDFKIIASVGHGAFGSVNLCFLKPNPGDLVAIKKISKKELLASELQRKKNSERSLQMKTSRVCPFIASLYVTFQDTKYAYFVMEYYPGGELFALLKREICFDDDKARFYAGCVLEALTFLHSKHIIYRDLKPENVVIDEHGYCKLTDFGFAKTVSAKSALRTYTHCGTPEYMAPEIVQCQAHSFPVDLWSLGVFVFELLHGKVPFRDENPVKLSESILRGIEPKIKVARDSNHISAEACSLIQALCHFLPEDRLGSGKNGISEVARHVWFLKLNWDALKQRKLPPPWVPTLDGPRDLRYCQAQNSKGKLRSSDDLFAEWDKKF